MELLVLRQLCAFERNHKSSVGKRIAVAGHKTSVNLEEALWNGLKEISGLRDMTLSELVGDQRP